jgi:hypothetical protein
MVNPEHHSFERMERQPIKEILPPGDFYAAYHLHGERPWL